MASLRDIPGNSEISSDGSVGIWPLPSNLFNPCISRIKIAQGRQFNLWWDTLIRDKKNIIIEADYNGTGGLDKERSFRVTPSSTGTFSLTLKGYDLNRNEKASKTISIDVVSKTAGTGTKKIFAIGDSLLANDGVLNEINTLITTDGGISAEWIGTQGTAVNTGSGVKHEANGGYGIIDYTFSNARANLYRFTVSGIITTPYINNAFYTNNGITFAVKRVKISGGTGIIDCVKSGAGEPQASGTLTRTQGTGDNSISFSAVAQVSANPFWDTVNSRIDFQKYITFWGMNSPDIMILQLSINDVGIGKALRTPTQINANITEFTKLINAMLSAETGYPSCKIIVCLEPISGVTKDGFAANYGVTSSKQAYEISMRAMHTKIIETYDNGVFNANVSVCPVFYWVDRYYGYIRNDVAVSSRTSTLVSEDGNGVHPGVDGEKQEADAIYSHIRSIV
jgi:lysophospholipase L1-like esterase